MLSIISAKGEDFFKEKDGCLERVKAMHSNLSKNLKAIYDQKLK